MTGYTFDDLTPEQALKNEIAACRENARASKAIGQTAAAKAWYARARAQAAKLRKLYDEMETEAEARRQARYGVGL